MENYLGMFTSGRTFLSVLNRRKFKEKLIDAQIKLFCKMFLSAHLSQFDVRSMAQLSETITKCRQLTKHRTLHLQLNFCIQVK